MVIVAEVLEASLLLLYFLLFTALNLKMLLLEQLPRNPALFPSSRSGEPLEAHRAVPVAEMNWKSFARLAASLCWRRCCANRLFHAYLAPRCVRRVRTRPRLCS